MSKVSRERQRPYDRAGAEACSKRANQCFLYRNVAKPGVYDVAGRKLRVETTGQIRRTD